MTSEIDAIAYPKLSDCVKRERWFMGDMGEVFNALKQHHKERKQKTTNSNGFELSNT